MAEHRMQMHPRDEFIPDVFANDFAPSCFEI